MSGMQIASHIFLWLSLALAAVFSALACGRRKNKLLTFTAGILLAVFALQICVNLGHPYAYDAPAEGEPLGGFALFARIFANTMQYFSLDAGYDEIVSVGALLFSGAERYVFYVLACAYTVLAPVAGGALVFAILCSLLPRLRLFFNNRRTKYVFSSLNKRSIETAESIAEMARDVRRLDAPWRRWFWHVCQKVYGRLCASGRHAAICSRLGAALERRKTLKNRYTDYREWPWLKSYLIVFLNVGSGADAELTDRAAAIGALCLKDDVLVRRFHWLCRLQKKLVYFLIDDRDEKNFDDAIALFSQKKRLWKRTVVRRTAVGGVAVRNRFKTDRLEAYVFTQDEEASAIIGETLKREMNESGVTVKIINEYRNLIYRLLDGDIRAGRPKEERAVPLYAAALTDGTFAPEGGALRIAIVGGGKIAREFFRAVCWCGQMMIPARDGTLVPAGLSITVFSRDEEAARRSLGFEMPGIFSENGRSYCTVSFLHAEYGTDRFAAQFAEGGGLLSDYVLVALGDDDLNLQAASWIARAIDRSDPRRSRPVPVTFAVESGALCETLAREQRTRGGAGCVLHPFGSLESRYHYSNIYMTALESRAWLVDRVHGESTDRAAFLRDFYKYGSSCAMALHSAYKMVSLGVLRSVDTDIEDVDVLSELYERLSDRRCEEALAWLEHRRWCAYMYTLGWRQPSAREFFSYAWNGERLCSDNTRRDALRFQPCLAEGAGTSVGIRAMLCLAAERSGLAWRPSERNIRGEWDDAFDAARLAVAGHYDLFGRIRTALRQGDGRLLEAWTAEAFGDPAWDALDGLSLLWTLLRERPNEQKNNAVTDYKAYDFKMNRALFDGVCRGAIFGWIGHRERRYAAVGADGLRGNPARGARLLLQICGVELAMASAGMQQPLGTLADGRMVRLCIEPREARPRFGRARAGKSYRILLSHGENRAVFQGLPQHLDVCLRVEKTER